MLWKNTGQDKCKAVLPWSQQMLAWDILNQMPLLSVNKFALFFNLWTLSTNSSGGTNLYNLNTRCRRRHLLLFALSLLATSLFHAPWAGFGEDDEWWTSVHSSSRMLF